MGGAPGGARGLYLRWTVLGWARQWRWPQRGGEEDGPALLFLSTGKQDPALTLRRCEAEWCEQRAACAESRVSGEPRERRAV